MAYLFRLLLYLLSDLVFVLERRVLHKAVFKRFHATLEIRRILLGHLFEVDVLLIQIGLDVLLARFCKVLNLRLLVLVALEHFESPHSPEWLVARAVERVVVALDLADHLLGFC